MPTFDELMTMTDSEFDAIQREALSDPAAMDRLLKDIEDMPSLLVVLPDPEPTDPDRRPGPTPKEDDAVLRGEDRERWDQCD